MITDPPASPSSSLPPSTFAPTAVDGDRDGFPGGLDCDDSNAAIRPGGKEIPGNTIDEDCNGIAEPRPRITSPVTWDGRLDGRRRTVFLRLRVTDLPAEATVELRCRGALCPFKKKVARRRAGDSLHLVPTLGRKRRLAPGLTFEVWIRAPQMTGKVIRFRTNRRKFATGVTMCLPVGKSVPQRVCA